jgi:hypothetical protein
MEQSRPQRPLAEEIPDPEAGGGKNMVFFAAPASARA